MTKDQDAREMYGDGTVPEDADLNAPGAAFLSPSFDDEPEVEHTDPVDDDQLTDDNTPPTRE